ncbi:hypothetical protein [Tautonia rosea]|uniref:hypothetical protein n=1 Tax=Tautonia rosea TaxID=2728037 RepID=UPI001473FDF4|nr:hypothetical protein [Tautonia rosea]
MRVRFVSVLGLAVLTIAALGGAADGQDQGIDSGPKLGEIVTPFDVYDVTGPNKSNELCYV